MSLTLKISSIAFILLVLIAINCLVVKDKISVKYSLVWSIPCLILLLFILIPGLLVWITNSLGFQTASNMIFAALIGLLLLISLSLTVIVSKQKNQIRLLIQEISLLKGNKNEK